MTMLARSGRAAGSVGLLTLGALALHEIRYALAAGQAPGAAIDRAGHGYLELLAPLLAVGAIAALIVSVAAPALLRLSPGLGDDAQLTERAAAYAAALLAVHLTQELTEGFLEAGHAGIVEALGSGGLVVMPLAMALGAIAAVARGWLDRAERRLVAALALRILPRAPRAVATPVAPRALRPLASLGLRFGAARRPPPAGLAA
ncbi:MAG TPA: hypothetical protein VK919_00320 [Solirubrobacterales bacterium]|nr:hypothetical protein [Solirubrobacterales bacterium]